MWRNGDSNAPIKIYLWLRVIFSDKLDLAAFALIYLAEIHKIDFPDGAEVLDNGTYVDDIGFSKDDTEDANRTMKQIDTILATRKFKVKSLGSKLSIC